MFEPVTRKSALLRMAITGVSGAGKTLSALYIAYGMTGDWGRVALIDTEHERGRFYASRNDGSLPYPTGAFLYQPLSAPYSVNAYVKLIRAASEAVGEGGVVIVDSLSHAWSEEGGVLDYKSKLVESGNGNDYTAWNKAGQEQQRLVRELFGCPAHTIVTMRSKMAYELQTNDRGRKEPVKLGLKPIQRDDLEYEFDIVMSINREHVAITSKDVTVLDGFEGVLTPDVGAGIAKWITLGANPTHCSDCGRVIASRADKSAEEIEKSSVSSAGRALCYECYLSAYRRYKARVKQIGREDPAFWNMSDEEFQKASQC